MHLMLTISKLALLNFSCTTIRRILLLSAATTSLSSVLMVAIYRFSIPWLTFFRLGYTINVLRFYVVKKSV